MTEIENKALALRYFDGEWELVDKECRCFLSGDMPCSGWMKAHEKKALGSILKTVGPVTTTIGDMVAEGDRVWVEWEISARLTNGNTYNNCYVYMFRFRDKKIVEFKSFVDTLHMYRTMDAPEVRGEAGKRQSPLTSVTARIVADAPEQIDGKE
ncbi:nuclear transport factor 2 family protein [Mesorhizobium sp.]|uniref:nuclear transport factor 2 family protein n=1 Tax=Mesorhizobium sp. TaxID=1871066 RepID=UPI000FE98120|nr:nuclear transport factor 2 family protein [Mesorhizobium sp.]RWF86825.1 MAG: nuclear transport factor 2 family protein [Mesorhizobium sp.]RWF90784.1 MAG: nuclear transport factor 2 family protein [Mesorhizobium sp.]RWJ56946.1 MAG: nuclear transport factor 2 family protein [Mesorhizobium sp.]RWJ63142.1 MAG: nuclear transport factor 2 family protein [Mesorhizobium sp.]RWJ92564.1 MAG: nuclear transport factor 2 family protein [Mesorhizobium sp.]